MTDESVMTEIHPVTPYSPRSIRIGAVVGLCIGVAASAALLFIGVPQLSPERYAGRKLSPDKRVGRYLPEPPGEWPILWPRFEYPPSGPDEPLPSQGEPPSSTRTTGARVPSGPPTTDPRSTTGSSCVGMGDLPANLADAVF